MKIAHVSIYPAKNKKHSLTGGVASYTKNLVTNIPYQNSDTVSVLCDKINGFEEYQEDNLNIIRCFDKNVLFFFQLFKYLKKNKPELIHIQQELSLYGNIVNAYILSWLIFLFRKKKVIVTLHGVVSLKGINKKFVRENNSRLPVFLVRLGFKIIFKPICFWSTIIIVHEECFKKILIEEYFVSRDKIEVVPHGIENFKTISKKEAGNKLNLDPNRDTVLFMGYLTGYKGLDLLLEGFSLYTKVNPNSFLIIGAGKHPKLLDDKKYLSEYFRIKNKVKELIPENQYSWVGFIDEENITNYYCASDLSVYPYTTEMSSSGPMMIALGHEKPFIASDVFSNLVGCQEMLFERKPEELAVCLSNFFKNKEHNFDYIRRLKNDRIWSIIALKTYQLYKQII